MIARVAAAQHGLWLVVVGRMVHSSDRSLPSSGTEPVDALVEIEAVGPNSRQRWLLAASPRGTVSRAGRRDVLAPQFIKVK